MVLKGRFPVRGLLTVLAAGLLAGTANADRPATYWNVQSGDFFELSNWNLGIPGTSLDAKIDNGGTAYITVPTEQSVPYVILGSEQNTSGKLEISGGGTARFTSMIVGAVNAAGTLDVLSGGELSSFGGAIGSDYLGRGVATVAGTDSLWSITGSEMVVGGNGTGTLRVQDGGLLTVGGGNGRIQLGNHPVSEGNLYVGAGGLAGGIDASEIYNGQGKATLTFNHSNPALNFAPKLTGLKTVNGYLNVRHEGTGTTVLTATESNLAGTITVAAGTLLVNGRIMGSVATVVMEEEVTEERTVGETLVLPQGTLGGIGLLEGKTTIQGTLAPGVTTGLLSFGGDLSLESTGTVTMELGGTLRGTQFDAINVAGSLLYGGTLKIVFVNGFVPGDGATFDLFNGFAAQSGTFADIQFVTSGYAGQFDAATGVLAVATIPEPSTFGLVAIGFAALGARRRIRK